MIKNEMDRKRPASMSLSANDKKLIKQVAKEMERSQSGAVMVLVKRYLEKRK